jgi:hypothetical protein
MLARSRTAAALRSPAISGGGLAAGGAGEGTFMAAVVLTATTPSRNPLSDSHVWRSLIDRNPRSLSLANT